MSRLNASRFPLIALALVLALSIACGGDDDDTATDTGGSATSVPNPASATSAPEPTTPIDPATGLPITFPDEFPVYQPTSVSRASDYGDRFVMHWRTADSVDTVAAFYQAELATAPWSLDEASEEGEAMRIAFTADGFSGEIAIAPTSGETIVLLNLVVEE